MKTKRKPSKSKGKSKSLKPKGKSLKKAEKNTAFRPVTKLCRFAERITGKLGSKVGGSADRARKAVKKIHKNLDKAATAIEKLYDTQSKYGM